MNTSFKRIQRIKFVAALLASGIVSAGAHKVEGHDEVKPVRMEKLANAPGQTLTAVTVNYTPGGKSGAHHHAGSVFAYVLTGAIRSENSATGPVKVYKAGENFFEAPGSEPLVSENASATESASLPALFIAPDGATLTTFDAASPKLATSDSPTADIAGVQHETILVNGMKLHYVVAVVSQVCSGSGTVQPFKLTK